jgi:hypothetical protein
MILCKISITGCKCKGQTGHQQILWTVIFHYFSNSKFLTAIFECLIVNSQFLQQPDKA